MKDKTNAAFFFFLDSSLRKNVEFLKSSVQICAFFPPFPSFSPCGCVCVRFRWEAV